MRPIFTATLCAVALAGCSPSSAEESGPSIQHSVPPGAICGFPANNSPTPPNETWAPASKPESWCKKQKDDVEVQHPVVPVGALVGKGASECPGGYAPAPSPEIPDTLSAGFPSGWIPIKWSGVSPMIVGWLKTDAVPKGWAKYTGTTMVWKKRTK